MSNKTISLEISRTNATNTVSQIFVPKATCKEVTIKWYQDKIKNRAATN